MAYTIDIGDGADALTINQLTDALQGTYWVDGWTASAGAGDHKVDIAPGTGVVDGSDVETTETQTVDLATAVDSDQPRKAVVYVDSSGTADYTAGDPAPAAPDDEIRFRTWDPAPPETVAGVAVAEVWLGAGAASVESADLRDRRVTNDAAESVIESFSADGSGQVEAGDVATIYATELASGETLAVRRGTLLLSNGEPVPSGVDLVIATLDGSGGGTRQSVVFAGDGTTSFAGEAGDPLAQYVAGGDELVMVGIDNGHFGSGSGTTVDVIGAASGGEYDDN